VGHIEREGARPNTISGPLDRLGYPISHLGAHQLEAGLPEQGGVLLPCVRSQRKTSESVRKNDRREDVIESGVYLATTDRLAHAALADVSLG
jgi:hypothetical protein